MKKIVLLSSIFFCYLNFSYSQLDPSFGNKGIVKTDMGSHFDNGSAARQVLIKPNGSMYVILDATFICKRFPDGSIDSSYGLDGYSRSVPLTDAYAALQPDGKIVIAGSEGNNSFGVARINTNGMPDSTFGNNGMQSTEFEGNSFARSVAIQSDGKIVVAGSTNSNEDTYFAVVRYNTDGSSDNTFNGSGQVITNFGFKFPPDILDEIDYANSVAIQADGKIVVGGYVYTGDYSDYAMSRYKTDGTLDSTFDDDGIQTTDIGSFNDIGYSLAIQSDGKILLGGYSSSDGSNNHFAVVRYNIDGSLDNSFNGNGKQTADLGSDIIIGNSVALQSNGKIVIAGYTLNGSYNDFAVARFNTNGSPDNTFDNDGMLTTDFTSSDDYAGSVAIQSDNKIVVAGYVYTYSSSGNFSQFALTRYNENGSLDNSFDGDGKLEGDYKQGYTEFNASAIQTDGKIVAAGFTWNGSNYDFAITRYNTNGSPDSTFSDDGKQTTNNGSQDDKAYSVVIQTDGKIIVAGSSNSQFALARYNTDGSPDNTFSGDGKLTISMGFSDVCQSVALQSDGKIVVAGYTFIDSNYDSAYFAIVRFNNDGTPDNTFSQDGKQLTGFNSSPAFAASVAVQNDGKIVVAGRSYVDNTNNFCLARYNTDGSLDDSFSDDGKQNNVFGADDYYGQSVAIQNDGKIVLAGFSETSDGSSSSFAAARYKINGELDSTFGNDGFQSTYLGAHFNFGLSMAINNDGRIAVGGTNDNYAIVLYKNDGSLDNTFSDDGIQTTNIGIEGSSIQSLAFADDKLYASGYGQFPGTLGVVARYLLPQGGAVPVSLLDFKAVLQNKSIMLQWEIATEKNLSTFVIERSADGNRFLPISSVVASGAGTFTRNYSIVDKRPLEGINFYRLKMVDVDGKFTYSNIVAVKINADKKLQIFPNPAKEILFVEANGNNENATFEIIDAVGRKLKKIQILLNGKTSFSIDVSNLPKGIYNLILFKGQNTEIQKFIKE